MAATALPPSAASSRLSAALLFALAAMPAAMAGVRLDRVESANPAPPAAPRVAAAAGAAIGASGPAHAGERACLRVLRAVARGQAFVAADLREDRCDGREPLLRAHYDRGAGLVRAPADLAAGAALLPVAPGLFAEVRQGDKVALIYRDGAIALSRSGVAARDSKPGAPVRVVLADGAVTTAPASASSAPSSFASMPPARPSSSRSGETP